MDGFVKAQKRKLGTTARRSPALASALRRYNLRRLLRDGAQVDLRNLASLARSGGDILDVGANAGFTAMAMAGAMPAASGWIFALEPQSESFNELSKAAKGLPILPLHCAAGASPGFADLTWPGSTDHVRQLTRASLVSSFPGSNMERVRVITLDSLIPVFSRYIFIRLFGA